jgi:HEPN/RES N-terminal domain 1/RES domain
VSEMVCGQCFTDTDIQEFVEESGVRGECDFCSQGDRNVATVEDIARFIKERVREEYRPVDEEDVPWDAEEDRYFIETFDMEDLLRGELGEVPTDNSELEKQLLEALGDQLWCERDWTMLSREQGLSSGWHSFSRKIKHETRYLFFGEPEEREGQDREFVEAGEMLSQLGALVNSVGLFRVLNAGQEYWRVRWDGKGQRFESPTDLGPPPEDRASQSRMSAAGIVAFYLAENMETAIAETREEGPGVASAGRFKFLADLVVLDLLEIPAPPSILDREAPRSRPALKFLHEFRKDIAKAIKRDGSVHFEYTPTQVVTEYFRQVFRVEGKQKLDGIRYPSSKGKGGNLVLFYDRRHVSGIADDYLSQNSKKYFELTGVESRELGAA